MRKHEGNKSRRGVVLVLVLVVLMLVSTLAMETFFTAQTALAEGRARLGVLERELALRSGLRAAAALLEHDRAQSTVDDLEEDWNEAHAFDLAGGCRVHFQIEDEQAKLNLNRLVLWDERGTPTQMHRDLGRLLADFGVRLPLSKDAVPWPTPLDDLGRLVRPPQGYGKMERGEVGRITELRRWLTVHGPGTVNINTAPPEVLRVLFGRRGRPLADRIVRERAQAPLENLAILRSGSGFDATRGAALQRLLSVSSGWFRVEINAEDSVGRSRAWAVLQRTSDGVFVRQWRTP